MDFVLGMNGGLYYGEADAGLASMEELTNVRDVTLSMEAGEADITARDNEGWRATAPTLRELTLEFEMRWKPGDAGFEAIRDGFLEGTLVGMCALDQKEGDSGAQGPRGNFAITSFSRSEPLEEAMTVSVTAKLAKFLGWEGGGGTG